MSPGANLRRTGISYGLPQFPKKKKKKIAYCPYQKKIWPLPIKVSGSVPGYKMGYKILKQQMCC